MVNIITQSTISNNVGVAAAWSYFHKGSVSQLINYGSFLDMLLGFENFQSWCIGGLTGPPEDPKVLIIVQNNFRGQSLKKLAFQIIFLYSNKRVDHWGLKPFSVSSLYVRAAIMCKEVPKGEMWRGESCEVKLRRVKRCGGVWRG